ncbi:hypothetical protein BTO16_14800 [Polaribacter glomeratus]|uniref:Uncharacterized protein n=2 Tax=Polaribacter glomeratus TaxID=102 RepID=A0A2S7WHM4_9FLAO|nr:hypothetical protein BTO16_14800 [Polaribacter glomeratus]
MMLSGYFKNPETLKLHLIKHQQLAERDNFVSLVEFYDNCNIVIENIKESILKLYYERKKELYWILSKQKTENVDTKDIQKDIDFLKPNDFKTPLLFITNQQFTGHLSYSDIEFIEDTIKQIFVYVDEKKDYTLPCNEGNFYYSGSENKLYSGKEFFSKIYLTTDNLKFPVNCPDLIPKYYDFALAEYLKSEKEKSKLMFSNVWVTKEFIVLEFKKLKSLINGLTDFIEKNKHYTFKSKENQLKYSKKYSEFLNEKLKELDKIEDKEPQQIENNKPNEVKKTLKDFFNSDVSSKVIETLQNDFKDYKGKKMAYLIYLLDKEFNLINYSLNSKNDSRKHFVETLTNNSIKMQGINKYFDDVKINIRLFEKDSIYTNIKDKLTKTIK